MEVKTMQRSNQLLKPVIIPVIILMTGIALVLGVANYFTAEDTDGQTTATAPPPVEAATTAEAHAPPAAPDAPGARAAEPVATAKGGVDIKTLSEDISMLETVDAHRQETATTEPSPEELVANLPPMERAATSRLTPQETESLESQLRLEPEHAASMPTQGNDGLLAHERL